MVASICNTFSAPAGAECDASVSYIDHYPKNTLGFEYALRMLTQRSVPEVAEGLLAGVQPDMNCHVIFRLATNRRAEDSK
jgi:hypothetical protein